MLPEEQVPRYDQLYEANQLNKKVQSNPALRWFVSSALLLLLLLLLLLPLHCCIAAVVVVVVGLKCIGRCPNANCNTIVHKDKHSIMKRTPEQLKVPHHFA